MSNWKNRIHKENPNRKAKPKRNLYFYACKKETIIPNGIKYFVGGFIFK
jgi:hypothetical protein